MCKNLSLLLVVGAIPMSFGLAGDEPSEVVRMARRISVNEFGGLNTKKVEMADVPIFDLNGRDWFLESKGDKWLIRRAISRADDRKLSLGFQTKRSEDAERDQVVLKVEPDENCFWIVEVDEKSGPLDPKRSQQYCYLKASSGDFRGWYLTPGEPTKVNNNVVHERAAILSNEKLAKSRLRVWQDGK